MTASSPLNLPRHVAIIMDGNGRWACERGLPRIEGHRAGAEVIDRVLQACADLGIPYLTLYAFSTENWQRPVTEVRQLMGLLRTFLRDRLADLQRHQVRLRAIGELDRLPRTVRVLLDHACRATAGNRRATLILALSYGARREITEAVRSLARDAALGRIDPDAISEEMVTARLYTADIPDPDLVIRTSGEFRLSNFLLWQASYAELWVTPVLWPDFSGDDLRRAVEEYSHRQRRFGGRDHA